MACGSRNAPTGLNTVDFQPVGIWDSPGYATDIVVLDDYAYLADDQAGFHVINVTDPTQPTLVSTLGELYDQVTILSAAKGVNLLSIVDGNNQRYFYNITDPDSVTAYDGTDSNTRTNDIMVIAGSPDAPDADSLMMLFTGDSNDGLTFTLYQSFRFGAITSWAGVANSETQTPGRTLGLAHDGYLILTAQDQMGLVIYDFSEYNNPVKRGQIDTPGSARRVVTQNSIAYIADGRSGLQIVSYQNPDSIESLGAITVPGYANDVAVIENTAFVASGIGGTIAIDVSNPKAPQVIGRYQDTYANAVVATSQTVYVADRDEGLLIFTPGN